jgi:SAM-dependent methyltransferase
MGMTTEFSIVQFASAYPDGIENHWWHLARNRTIKSVIKAFVGSNAVVLDVGCGRGIAVNYLRDKGIDCTGVEFAEVHPIFPVRNCVRVGIKAGDLPFAERKRYDTILLLDVIEHISDPICFLQQLLVVFPNASHLIITVPARQELWSNYDEFYGHYRRYTIEMLKSLSNELHVSNSWESYFFHLVYPISWAVANLTKNRKTKLNAPQSQLSKWAHKLISYFMILDYYFLPRQVPGMSVLACFSLVKNPARPFKPISACSKRRPRMS